MCLPTVSLAETRGPKSGWCTRSMGVGTATTRKSAFPKSVAMQYANFMPGEWLPESDKGYLKSVFEKAKELKVGVAGPDLIPWKPGQMKHSYPLIRGCNSLIPTGIAVQEGNYSTKNPKTGRLTTVQDLYEFARDYLKVQYVFWCDQEPYYSKKVVPFLEKRNRRNRR